MSDQMKCTCAIANKDSHLVTKTWWNFKIWLMIHNVLFDQEQDPIVYVQKIWLTEWHSG